MWIFSCTLFFNSFSRLLSCTHAFQSICSESSHSDPHWPIQATKVLSHQPPWFHETSITFTTLDSWPVVFHLYHHTSFEWSAILLIFFRANYSLVFCFLEWHFNCIQWLFWKGKHVENWKLGRSHCKEEYFLYLPALLLCLLYNILFSFTFEENLEQSNQNFFFQL